MGTNGMDRESVIIRPLEAVIDLEKIRHNIKALRALLPPGCRFMAVVKANAYGHGDIEVSKAALEAGADCLGVALVEEALKLREAGFECPVHVLFEPPVSAARFVVENDLTQTVYTHEFVRSLSLEASMLGKQAKIHLKVDTGMRRVGVEPGDVRDFTSFLAGFSHLDIEGISTHFAVATEIDNQFTMRQMDLFEEAAKVAEGNLGKSLLKHAANSAAVIAHPRSHYDMVRLGIAIYGYSPSAQLEGRIDLKPALSLKGRVAFVKRINAGERLSYGQNWATREDTWIATIPIGYADGMSRLLSNKAAVLIGGKRKPVVGTICMDLCMVDLGKEPVDIGEPFVLIGRDGEQEITATEIASNLGTIDYEVLCMIGKRVPRTYVDHELESEGD
ncbi:MAG: alanine racemase [Actinomycetota bacterium]|nr:alanine racemase [Actinomycetota bacterium]